MNIRFTGKRVWRAIHVVEQSVKAMASRGCLLALLLLPPGSSGLLLPPASPELLLLPASSGLLLPPASPELLLPPASSGLLLPSASPKQPWLHDLRLTPDLCAAFCDILSPALASASLAICAVSIIVDPFTLVPLPPQIICPVSKDPPTKDQLISQTATRVTNLLG